MTIRWLTIFLDTPRAHPAAEEVPQFWCDLTGGSLSPWRVGTFATVLPARGDATLRLQLTDGGAPGTHLDLHVDDPAATVRSLVGSGARVLDETFDDVTVLMSPAGLVFCVVASGDEQAPPAPLDASGVFSVADQICLDIPAAEYDDEVRWWREVTGWELSAGSRTEFRVLERPTGVPVRILLHRTEAGPAGMHLDLASSDRAVSVREHLRRGAARVAEGARWTVLVDPVGRVYCVTDRDPVTGRLPAATG